ncbi:MAG: hemerythrin domain-containing protein [Sandaracinaceae bacterium]|nr:hemerythrin domain-containing protein [Sandaracinaceae bacterium]
MTHIDTSSKLGDLATHIEELIALVLREHHDVERRELPRLVRLAEKVTRRHAGDHPELVQLAEHIQNLADELDSHLDREERVLFPYLLAVVAAARGEAPLPAPSFHSLRNPLRIMSAEHAVEDELLSAIRAIADDYGTPPDADEPWRNLLEGLATLDVDLTRHMMLEDSVLFPLALELEQRLGIGG